MNARPNSPGFFVTIDGVEGAGKTTQAARLADVLRREGADVLVTREPGGTELGRALRALLLDANTAGPAPETELLLYLADRAEHVRRLVLPALRRGAVVIADRFSDSTIAYQVYGRGLPEVMVRQLDEFSRDGVSPDLTFLLDLPAEEGLARANARGAADRFERESLEFHNRVRTGFQAIAKAEPSRVMVIDAQRAVDQIGRELQQIARRKLEARAAGGV